MKEQINNALTFLKEQDIDACITGSVMLDYFEGQDIDVFCYSESSMTKLLYILYFNKMFLLIDPLEKWKFKEWTEKDYKTTYKKLGLVTIKFKYNTCIDINIILKNKCDNIFSVLSTFDLDIICKGFDIKSKQYLDLSNGAGKIVSFNKWNNSINDINIWSLGRILRQLERIIKYYNRGYNTDNVAILYKKLINDTIELDNIFDSEKIKEKESVININGNILITLIDKWLETHSITEEELDLLKKTVKLL